MTTCAQCMEHVDAHFALEGREYCDRCYRRLMEQAVETLEENETEELEPCSW